MTRRAGSECRGILYRVHKGMAVLYVCILEHEHQMPMLVCVPQISRHEFCAYVLFICCTNMSSRMVVLENASSAFPCQVIRHRQFPKEHISRDSCIQDVPVYPAKSFRLIPPAL